MSFIKSARGVFLAAVCVILLNAPVFGEEQSVAPAATEPVEVAAEEKPAAAKEPEQAVEIPQIEVLAFKEKAATS